MPTTPTRTLIDGERRRVASRLDDADAAEAAGAAAGRRAPTPTNPSAPDRRGPGRMTRFRVAVHIMPRRGLLDPQGKAVADALHTLGFAGVARRARRPPPS